MVTEDTRLKLAGGYMGFRYAVFSTFKILKFPTIKKRLFSKSPLRVETIIDLFISFEFEIM